MRSLRNTTRTNQGAVLVIVLAFVVLLTGLTVAYLSRVTGDRQIAQGSINQAKVDQLAGSAIEIIVGDLRDEIATGGAITSLNVTPQRYPAPAPNSTPIIPNLIRRSVRADPIAAPAIASRASAVNSTTDASVNGRSISLARWNSHYLVPKSNTGDDNPDPITASSQFAAPSYWAPDWVLVTRNGPSPFTSLGSGATALNNSTSANPNYVIGRYAYAIYDEGGLLDLNVAGYPYPSPSPATTPATLVTSIGRKGTSAFADLTGIRTTSSGTPSQTSLTKMMAWRNYATVQATGTFPTNLVPADQTEAAFVNFCVGNPQIGINNGFLSVSTAIYNLRTDQALASRKQLIELIRSSGATFNLLQFLGTFSRERNVPTWTAGATLTERFYIGNLSLIQPNPAAATTADIKKYFGLQWIVGTSGSAGPPVVPAVPGHWRYVGSTGTAALSQIPAFTTDPEFFQLLNYGLNSTNANDAVHLPTTLAIGAALIDQYDTSAAADPTTGTTTTMIEYSGGWALGLENVDPARPSTTPAPSPFPTPGGMSPTPPPAISTYVMLNRPFRNVGEFGYAFRAAASPTPTPVPNPKTLDFVSAGSADGPLLDLFTYNKAAVRSGVVNLNTQSIGVIAAILRSAISDEASSAVVGLAAANNAAASPTPAPTLGIVTHPTNGTLMNHAIGRQEIPRLVAAAGTTIGTSEEAKETVARALSEVCQTRTWGLLIDVIAQSGRYPPNAGNLANFLVEGEKRYWLHIAIDRFTGEVIDQQLEVVNE